MEIKSDILAQLYELNSEEIAAKENNENGINSYSRYKNNSLIISQNKLFTDNKSIYIRKHTRFAHIPNHSHDFVECCYIINGQLTHRINDKDVFLKEGEIILMNENSSHEILKSEYNDLAINFIIKSEFLRKILIHVSNNDEFCNFIIRNFIHNINSPEYYIFKNLSPDIKNILSLIINHYYSNDSQEKVNLLFAYVLTELFTKNIYESTSNIFDSKYVVLFTRKYIDKNYSSGNLSELSNLLSINYHYLSTCIKREIGFTFKELQQNRRMEIAMNLVCETAIPIKEIGQCVGYENTTFFYKLFKKHFGENPNHYRSRNMGTLT